MNERPREFVRPEYRYIYEKREEDVGGLRGAEGGGASSRAQWLAS